MWKALEKSPPEQLGPLEVGRGGLEWRREACWAAETGSEGTVEGTESETDGKARRLLFPSLLLSGMGELGLLYAIIVTPLGKESASYCCFTV